MDGLAMTVRPAVSRFAEIERIYRAAHSALPEEVQDGWAQFSRAVEWAEWEFRTGLWL